ncbi:glycosyltransferase family 4 protein [Nocardiopsis metallicus]|uniref:Glycosyltransferase involved in cell wall biosynthesis n=1 Tax=Nocardiopsis metallicus TaxID=179819 RepID=A0A840W9E4_9ACTN|nr:glycosyltransferase family 4 protein [Nocardiopsis metallicus]MBB5492702.1 glycosyltransferase involved in cell wall biosynthesis [Nocardiopsis metallicus]
MTDHADPGDGREAPAARRITLVGPAHPYKGGGARHTTELAHRLRDLGHEAGIESWRAQYPAALYPGQQTITDPEGEPFPRTRHELAWYRPDGWWRTGRRLAGESDLVVLTLFSPVQVPAYLGILAGIRSLVRGGGRSGDRNGGAGPRVVVLCHNVLPHERRAIDVCLVRALLRRVDGVLTHSAEQGRLAEGLLGPGAPAPVVAEMPPHLPDTGGVRSDEHTGECRSLLFFGIVRPYKGVDVLLRALAEGAPEDVTLTVAGEFWGGYGDLAALAGELGLGDRVRFREGYVPADELPELLAGADALVLPYRSATATQNVWLAHEHGLPVIATRAGTLADHVREGVDGLLCEPGDAADLARALRAFYRPGEPARLREGARPVDAEPYWKAYTDRLLGT